VPGKGPPNKAEVQRRESIVWDLRAVRGWTLQRIADELGLTPEGVRQIEKRITAREAEKLSANYHHLKGVHHARNEWIWASCLAAYEKSKEPQGKVRESEKDGDLVRVTESVSREGNPYHLTVGMQALEADRKLLGLDVQAAANPLNDHSADIAELELQIKLERSKLRALKKSVPPAPPEGATDEPSQGS
jgi:hypothetical protein